MIVVPVSYPGDPAFSSRPGNCLHSGVIFLIHAGEQCDNRGYRGKIIHSNQNIL
jgi:hypothetical protein